MQQTRDFGGDKRCFFVAFLADEQSIFEVFIVCRQAPKLFLHMLQMEFGFVRCEMTKEFYILKNSCTSV